MLLPSFLKRCFWDVEFKDLDVEKDSKFIIERVIEEGDIKSVRWLLKKYHLRTIRGLVKKSRGLSKKTANFWAVYFNIPKEDVLCLSKQFQKQHRVIWKY
jgi:hypothetical protein